MDADDLRELTPGLLRQNLAINRPDLNDIERRQAKHKLQQLTETMQHRRPHCSAFRNMIAVLHYRLDEDQDASDILEDILKEDPNNLNVLQDLITIYERDFRHEDKVECERRLKTELDKIETEEISENVLVFARCIAGKGFAWGFDIHPESKDESRLRNSIACYEQALRISGDLVDKKEKEDWLYYLALSYIRLNNVNRVFKDRVRYLQRFDRVLNCLRPNIECDDKQRRSASWGLLGDLFAQKPNNATGIPESIENSELKSYWFSPEKCYLRALELNATNWEALNQLAHLYSKQGKEEEALELLGKSLKVTTAPSNTYARHVRAQIHLHLFNRQLQRKLQKKGPPPDRTHLHEAKSDLLSCIQHNPYVLDMIHLAEVHHKLAWNEESGVYENTCLHEALRWCTKAEKCQDGAIRPDLHQRRAFILQDLGDIDDAIKCFMQAVDCERPGSASRNFIFMIKAMLKRYHKSESKPKSMLYEIAYWLVQGFRRYSNCKIGQCVTGFPEEMTDVAELMCDSRQQSQMEVAWRIVKSFKDKQVVCDAERLAGLDQKTKSFAPLSGSSRGSAASFHSESDGGKSVTMTAKSDTTEAGLTSTSCPETTLEPVDRQQRSTESSSMSETSAGNLGAGALSKTIDNQNDKERTNTLNSASECSDGHHCSSFGPIIKIQSTDIADRKKEEAEFQGQIDCQKIIIRNASPRNLRIGVPPQRPTHIRFQYDVFIVFDTDTPDTRSWVYYHLRSQLEQGRDALKCCIPARDLEENASLHKNVTTAMERSAKVLVVISGGFQESNKCQEMIRNNLEMRDKMILVMTKKLSLPSYLESLPCEDATGIINWKRILELLS